MLRATLNAAVRTRPGGAAWLVVASLACGDDGDAAQNPPEPPPAAMQPANAPNENVEENGKPVRDDGTHFGRVALNPGFTPDPYTTGGTSGGTVNAQTLDENCSGWISETPDHILDASDAFAVLRVLAKAEEERRDLTLVIQKPDESYLCADDTDTGLNPIISSAFPTGTYKVWLGSFLQEEETAYRLGFTELDSIGFEDLDPQTRREAAQTEPTP